MADLRKCRVCGGEFPVTPEYWYRERKAKAGLSGACKSCDRERASRWYQDNPERGRASRRAYKRSPESRRAEYGRRREKILDYARRYREENGETLRRKQREYVAGNPEAEQARKRRAHVANREANNARTRAWCAANPEHVRALVAKYRARRREAPGRITAKDIRAQYATQRGTCFYCPQSLADVRFHVDHHVPLSKGGTNEPENIVLACPSCNIAKRDKLPGEFRPRKE